MPVWNSYFLIVAKLAFVNQLLSLIDAAKPGARRAWVACSSCKRRTHNYDTLEEAVGAWNQGQRIPQLEPAVAEKSSLAPG